MSRKELGRKLISILPVKELKVLILFLLTLFSASLPACSISFAINVMGAANLAISAFLIALIVISFLVPFIILSITLKETRN